MKTENIIAFTMILLLGMTIGAITASNLKENQKKQLDELQTKLFEIQSKNLDLIQENILLKN